MPDPLSAEFRKFWSAVDRESDFILTTHVNPDGDGIGSELGLAQALRQLGKRATILNHNDTPENYRWLDPAGHVTRYNEERDRAGILEAGVIVVLDTNQPSRLRSLEEPVRKSAALKIVIDHHLEPDGFADQYVIDERATSTGEILYRLLGDRGGLVIDPAMARALYTAMMTDTGSFRYPRTDGETLRIAAELLDRGADPTEAFVNVYENWTAGRLRLLGEALGSMKTACGGRIAYIVCTRTMFEETGTSEVETDNFTAFPMSIRGVTIGILFNELPDGVKISFRSKGSIPINELAKEFGGNGHLNAAGARLFNTGIDGVVRDVIGKAVLYAGTCA